MSSRAGLALAALMAAAAAASSGQTPAAAASPTPVPKPEAAASELPRCADCHGEQVQAFASNPHARFSHRQKVDIEDFCTTCHGDGTKHIEAGGEGFIEAFRGLSGAENCLSCHDKNGPNETFTTGHHSNSPAVNCLSCHSIHEAAASSAFLLSKEPGPLCATCHSSTAASFRNKPFTHRLDRGDMTCLACHNPHSRKGQMVRMTRDDELACIGCHSEKRGPFVFDHVTGSAGDCQSCHQPHGSNNPKMMLWARVDQLCLSCHSQTGGPRTAGGQPPSFHDLTLPRYRNCTTCHVAVHGSNLSEHFLK